MSFDPEKMRRAADEKQAAKRRKVRNEKIRLAIGIFVVFAAVIGFIFLRAFADTEKAKFDRQMERGREIEKQRR